MKLAFKIICVKCGLSIEVEPTLWFELKWYQVVKGGERVPVQVFGPCPHCGWEVDRKWGRNSAVAKELIYA